MKSLILILITAISLPAISKELYCVSEGDTGSKIKVKISRLPNDLEALLDSLPQLKNVRNPASENHMDDIMRKFFASDKDYTFSVKVDQSKYDDVIVKGLLGGRWENESSIAFMTDPNKPHRILKFQLAMSGLKGTLDYKGSRGNVSKHNLNCSHESLGF